MNEWEVAIASNTGGVWTRIVVRAACHADAVTIGTNMYRGVGRVMYAKQLTYTASDRRQRGLSG